MSVTAPPPVFVAAATQAAAAPPQVAPLVAAQIGGTVEAAREAVAGAVQAAGQALTAGGIKPLPSAISPPESLLSWGGYFQAIAWLCFILAALWVLLWLFKKSRASRFFPGASSDMSIESRLALGPKKWVVVVRYQDSRLVLGVTDHQINLLTEYDDECDDDDDCDDEGSVDEERLARTFAALLKKNRPGDEAGTVGPPRQAAPGEACVSSPSPDTEPCRPSSDD